MTKVAMISGGTRGIGLATALELLENGWYVSVGARNETKAFNAYCSDQILVASFDALTPETENSWIAQTKAHFGRIDAIVHNAGIMSLCSVIDANDAEFDNIFNINVKSPMRLTQKVWQHLVESGEGKVIVMASLAGKRIQGPEATLYAMSKSAALALAHGIRHCGQSQRIRATAICPGFVTTDMMAGTPEKLLAKLTQPQDIARIVRLTLELPFSASVAEITVNCIVEPQY